MWQVDTGLYTVLAADIASATTGTLGNLGVTAAAKNIAPAGTAAPYIIFQKMSGIDDWTFNDLTSRDLVYMIKVVASGNSALGAGKALARIAVLLNDGSLSISGFTLLRSRQESDIDYSETSSGITYHHIGGLFRISIRPSS